MVSNLHAYAGIDEKWKVRLYVASRFLAYAWTPQCFSRVLYGIICITPLLVKLANFLPPKKL